MGYRITKGVSERCIVRLLFTIFNLLLARAQMIGRLLLEWRTQQALEYKKKNMQYTNEEIFQDDQMVYLLAPHSSALQTDTTRFKQESIGPNVFSQNTSIFYVTVRKNSFLLQKFSLLIIFYEFIDVNKMIRPFVH